MLKGKALVITGLNLEDSKVRKPRSSWIKPLLMRPGSYQLDMQREEFHSQESPLC